MSDIVQKLWGFCHTLRHDGIDYGDYIEQITYLLFLKMADERGIDLPKDCRWPALRDKSGTDLTESYMDLLRKLGKQPGILGDIFASAQSRFSKRASKHIDTSLNLIGGRLGLDHDRVFFGRFGVPVMVRYLDKKSGPMDEKERDKLLFWFVQAGMWGRFSGSTESFIEAA